MINDKLKVVTIVGTRPEIIRLSVIIPLFDKYFNHILVHTGQNYDYELNEIFFEDLEIRKPNHFLNVDASSLGTVIGETISKGEKVLLEENPDAVLILGDTNSSLVAIIAKRLRIPIFHMEAGNRSFDMNVPEEINRKIVDHIADFNLVYTEHARRHLISEGLQHRRIYLTGSPLLEVINKFSKKINSSQILTDLELIPNKYFVVSIHREENVDNKSNLIEILNTLNSLSKFYNLPIIVSTHPRTRKRLEKLDGFDDNKLLLFMKPFGYFDYVFLQKNAVCVISDSGTISEESSILNFPAISIRQSMERPEAQDAGRIILTGFDKKTLFNSINFILEDKEQEENNSLPIEYLIDNTSRRVLKLIIGNTGLSNKWWGINK